MGGVSLKLVDKSVDIAMTAASSEKLNGCGQMLKLHLLTLMYNVLREVTMMHPIVTIHVSIHVADLFFPPHS